ncbi:MAG: ribonuclease P protein component [Cyanobium sp.]
MSLPQQHRLRGLKVFDRIYRQGHRFHGRLFTLRVMAADAAQLPPRDRPYPPSPWRCAVVVSSKVSKRSVQRNRLRRLVHAFLMAHPPQANEPCWLVFSLKPGSVDAEESLLLKECLVLLQKAGLHDGHPNSPGAGGSQHPGRCVL